MRGIACCALLTLALGLTAITATAATSSTMTRETSLERGIVREANRVRATHGLRALALSPALQAAANSQSRLMLAQGFFAHDTPGGEPFGDRLKRFYPLRQGPWLVGENLLWSSDGIAPAAAVRMWLDSPEHRKILLTRDWREVGVSAFGANSASGVYSAAQGPVVVVTMDFGTRGSR
jgi:uncharacterized protein YkwD